jgi:nucleoside-diphosphate-sugar epimerase
MKILVIGGTRFIGRHLVRALLHAGHAVTVLHRNAETRLDQRVEGLLADRNDAESVRAAIGGRRFHAVFDNVYDWQRGTTGAQVEATARICAPGLERYVFLSSVAAYGTGFDRREDHPLAADDFALPYGRDKAMSERALFQLGVETGLPVVTVRSTYVYGPENSFYREAFFWDRLLAGRHIIIPGDGSRPAQFTNVRDLISALLRMLICPAAVGQAFNCSSAPAMTQAALVDALAGVAGVEPQRVFVPREKIVELGGSPMGPLYFGERLDLAPITQEASKWKSLLGVQPTPFTAGLRETFEWYLKNRRTEPLNTVFEDRLLEAVQCQAAIY